MRIFLFFLFCFSLSSAYDTTKLIKQTALLDALQSVHALQAKAFEQNALNSDEVMQDMLKENQESLQNILLAIKEDPYSDGFIVQDAFDKHLLFLENRIPLNLEKGNEFAVKRDRIALAYLKQMQALNEYIITLCTMVQNFSTQAEIVAFSQNIQLQHQSNDKEVFTQLYKSVLNDNNALAEAIRENFKAYITAYETFERLLEFTKANANLLAQKTIFTLIDYDAIINAVNASPSARWLNKHIGFFYLNSGKLVSIVTIALLLGLSLYLSKWVLRFGFLNFAHYENRKLLRPIRLVLGVTALDYLILTLMYPLQPSGFGEAFILFAYVFALAYFAMELLAYLVVGYFEAKNTSDNQKALVSLSIDMLKTIFGISAFIFFLNKMGVSLQTVLTSLGIFGLGIALAAKDSLANFFGSLNILLDNTFSQGDYITIGDLEGEVVKVGLRSTKIRAYNNSMIIMPNAEAALKPIVNWSRRRLGREIKTLISVAYTTDPQKLREVVQEIRHLISTHPELVQNDDILKYESESKKELFVSKKHLLGLKKERFVYLDSFEPSHASILIQVFSRSTKREEWYKIKEELLYSIWEILNKHHLDFALPAQNLFLKNTDKETTK